MRSSHNVTLFWFREDLRLSDNPGLFEAAKNGPVLPIYILEDTPSLSFRMGSASKWWLDHSLRMLNTSLDGKLNVYKGCSKEILLKIIQENQVGAVYWNISYTPCHLKNDNEIKSALAKKGIECKSFNASLLWDPSKILKKDRSYYKIFTPFYRKGCLQAPPPRTPLPKPDRLSCVKDEYNQTVLSDLKLLPDKKWYQSLEACWEVGEKAAQKKRDIFLDQHLRGYKEGRNYPRLSHTSRLSPHLHFGEISPNQLWYAVQEKSMVHGLDNDMDCFLSEWIFS